MNVKLNRTLSAARRAAPESVALAGVLLLTATLSGAARADQAQIDRGQYLVQIGGCTDCHTPGYFLGNPDMARFLAGSDVGFEVPGVGIIYGPNLTPDDETGLGTWTADQIVDAIRTGMTPEGRGLVPVMPWPNLAVLSDEDAYAIAAFLQSLDPVTNNVPGLIPEGEPAPSFVMKIVPPGQ